MQAAGSSLATWLPSRLRRLAFVCAGFFAAFHPVWAGSPSWVELRTAHFTVYCDDGEAAARSALEGFEAIRGVYRQTFPGLQVDSPKPMLVLVTRNEDSMKELLPAAFSGKDPVRPAGYYFSREDRDYAVIRLDVQHQSDQPYFVVFHEYAHSIIHRNFPALPTWLDEGLADFFGATELHGRNVHLGRVPLARLATLRQEARLPLEALLTATQQSPFYQEGTKAGPFYAESWALVHYLYMDKKAKEAGLFRSYLAALERPEPPLQQAQEGFGDLNALSKALYLYVQRPSYQYLSLELTPEPEEAHSEVRKLDEAEALLLRAEFLDYTEQEPAARPLLKQAQSLGPQRSDVAVALGMSALRRGDRDQAKTYLEQALRLGSRDFRVPYHLAVLAQQRSSSEDPAVASQILSWLEAAKSLYPGFAGTWIALCRQYSISPKEPQKSIEAGRKALELEPRNLANWANFGAACMNLGDAAGAEGIAARLDQMASSSQERELVESYRAQLSSFKQVMASRREGVPETQSQSQSSSTGAAPVQKGPLAGQGLHFRLPASLNGLGVEVMTLVQGGHVQTAIQKVQAAQGVAKSAYERECLASLLKQLKALSSGYDPAPAGR